MSPESPGKAAVHRWVDSRGARLNVWVAGQGPPLLMLHGWTLDQRSFAAQVPALSAALQVIIPDRRGCGQSSGAPDLAAELEDIDCLLDALAGGSAHLLGVSQGGRLALRYAATRPDRVRSLILQGAVLDGFWPPDTPGEAIPLEDYARLARAGSMDEMRARWLAHPMMSAGIGGDVQQQLRDMVAGYRGEDLLSPPSAPDVDVVQCLAGRPLPALIITGEHEVGSRKAHAARLRELLPASEEACVEGAGHLCNLSHPARYNALVLEFCARVGGG